MFFFSLWRNLTWEREADKVILSLDEGSKGKRKTWEAFIALRDIMEIFVSRKKETEKGHLSKNLHNYTSTPPQNLG